MLKSDLVQKMQVAFPGMHLRDVQAACEAILNRITEALMNDGRVELRGFAAFSAVQRKARTGRNPKSGSVVAVLPKYAVRVRVSRELRQRLNPPK
jgi:integration host factor subunit beta